MHVSVYIIFEIINIMCLIRKLEKKFNNILRGIRTNK